MKIKPNSELSVHEILRNYSGRRLQYAIRIGILPAPEDLGQALKKSSKHNSKLTPARVGNWQ